jgi:hypothetical protein
MCLRVSEAGVYSCSRASYQDPDQVFTLFRGLRSSHLDLDLMDPVAAICPGGGVQFEAKDEFRTPGTQFSFQWLCHGIDLDGHVLRAPNLCAAGSF